MLEVASFTDAWIETLPVKPELRDSFVASFTDAWIETPRISEVNYHGIKSHLLQMRGLKQKILKEGTTATSRIFYRCVD